MITWTSENKSKLLACATVEEAMKAFPGASYSSLERRAREFRSAQFTLPPEIKDYTWTTEPVSAPQQPTNKWKGATITHIVVPDTQAAPGRPTDHLTWIGQYIVDHFAGKPNVKIIHLGDHADFPSLSSYDKGKRAMENRRVSEDIAAANHAFDVLNQPLINYNMNRSIPWWPERHILYGNHEFRAVRAVEDNPQLEGILSLDMLNYDDHGWQVHDFLKPVNIDEVWYSHYFCNPMSGKPYGGMAETRLKTLGFSFTQGHQQQLSTAVRFVAGKSQHALIAGAAYTWDENYKGYQGNAHWRGIAVCHDVIDGSYDLMTVSLNYLCRRYEGIELRDFMQKKYKVAFNGGWS